MNKMQVKRQYGSMTIVSAVLLVIMTELYRRMAVCYQGKYFSDIAEHLEYGREFGLKGEYSLTLLINDILALHTGLGGIGVGIHIALLILAGIVFSWLLMKKMVPDGKNLNLFLLSVAGIFVIPIYIPIVHPNMSGLFCSSCWHNENYIGMRTIALLLFVFLYDWIDDYLEAFTVRKMLIYALILSVINAIKPNFILGFAPAMLIMMIVDIIRAKGTGFWRWVMFGSSVLISLPVLLWQYYVTYDPNSVLVEDSQLVFVFGDLVHLLSHPILAFILAHAFPITVLLFWPKRFMENRFLKLILIGFVCSFLEVYFIAESGQRFYDGNMSWGMKCFISFIFIVCLAEYYKRYMDFIKDKKRNQTLTEYCQIHTKEAVKLAVSGLLFVWHLACGILYFAIVCTGVTGYLI